MPKLVVNPGTPQAREFELKPGTNYLGRGFANDFKIEDPSVSGSHAEIVLNGAAVMVKDLGSTNGTFINRSQVTEAALQPGHMLRLGGVEMLFQSDVTASEPVNSTVPGLTAMPPPPQANGVRIVAPNSPPPAPRLSSPTVATTLTPRITPTVMTAAPPVASPIAPAVMTAEPPISAPPMAPPLAPAIVPGMVEAPPGMTTCKYHPKAAGQWLCQQCRLLFCSLCVSTRRTESGTGYFCRKCGNECAPVKVKHVVTKEKALKTYSDMEVLMRAIGFGFGAAVLAGVLWTGFAALTQFDIPPIFCAATGALCGYGVKLGCQDRPGVIFSLMAVGFCLLGVIFGKVGMIIVTHNTILGISSMAYGLFGLMVGFFLAWKFGGGDF